MITMGCSKNLVDSEFLMAQFSAAGWEVDFDGSGAGYDAVIINTCGFIHDARQESVDMILQYAQARKNGEIGKLCVIGCLSERYKDELAEEILEADIVLGVNSPEALIRELEPAGTGFCSPAGRLLSTPKHYAYLKISEGCDRKCSFCIIPSIRGGHVSRTTESLVDETYMLSEKGVKELVLIAQDLTSYGTDLYGKPRLGDLLLQLQEINGIEWIRLHYAYPAGFPDDVLEIMASGSKICRYLDIPLQHISDNVLKRMRRGISGKKTLELIKKIRHKVPGIALRTTMLTGHPGETERDFEDLKNFVRGARFDRLGVFPYSHEEGTWAYHNLEDNIPLDEKERRAEEIMQIQQEISAEINSSYIGRHIKVLIDNEDEEYFQGRTEHDSPEVDNGVLVYKTGGIAVGNFVHAEVTGAYEFDLYAQPLP